MLWFYLLLLCLVLWVCRHCKLLPLRGQHSRRQHCQHHQQHQFWRQQWQQDLLQL
jgi:hypothetical protein